MVSFNDVTVSTILSTLELKYNQLIDLLLSAGHLNDPTDEIIFILFLLY